MKRKKQTVPGVRIEKDPETGLETVYPAKPNRPPAGTGEDPQPHEQIQYLIEFIDNFKNETNFNHIRDVVLFIALPLIENNPEALEALREALEAGRGLEQTEITQKYTENPEAGLDEIAHEGYEVLKSTLADIQGMTVEERQELLKTVYRKPTIFAMINTKPLNLMFDPKIDLTEETGVRVGKIGKKEAVVNVQMDYSAINDSLLPKNLTPFDREVLNGICSIANSGQTLMTVQMIIEAFTGRRNESKPFIRKVKRSIDKLRTCILSIDWTDHARMALKHKTGGTDIEQFISRDTILNMIEAYITVNGTKTHGYRLKEIPEVLKYGMFVGQVVTIDKSLLQVGDINNTDNNIVLKNYILRRIATMKNPNNKISSNTILFETAFNDCDMLQSRRNKTRTNVQLQRFRETIFRILDEYKAVGYITGYDVLKEGNRYKGVDIKYIPDPPQIPKKQEPEKEKAD